MDPYDTRYLLGPMGHKDNGEDLHFFFLKSGQSSKQDAAVLDELAKSMYLPSFSGYAVYGQYDVVVRCWLTPGDRDAITEELDTSFDDVRRFDVDKAFYD